MRRPKILRWEPPAGRRILVISDIHGNVGYLEGVLRKARFSDRDELIVDGDFLEKGPESLRALRILMALSRRGNVHAVLGNCDDWYDIYLPDWSPRGDEQVLRYMLWRKSGLLWDMCNAAGIDPFEMEDLSQAKQQLLRAFPEEWAFLRDLPHAIETERFVFVHAGMRPDIPLEEHSIDELVKVDHFMDLDRHFDKWVVVGHLPVVLYGKDKVCADPIVDPDKHIVSIDGGCVLKDDGQLNCLIVPHRDSEDFRFVSYDAFPERTVLDEQAEGARSYYIRWGDNEVEVLQRGPEFSRCRHVRTGYVMDILTKYLFSNDTITDCNDCTDYVLPLHPGDKIRVVEQTSRGAFVKHGGLSGWYYGRSS
ncbi:MAG: metallophosphoesterase [Oscillospiraceae bacterium]|nr:metallophosphoesterase [Oscillospiraceae bacterium]